VEARAVLLRHERIISELERKTSDQASHSQFYRPGLWTEREGCRIDQDAARARMSRIRAFRPPLPRLRSTRLAGLSWTICKGVESRGLD
jgi:hypothetical protein